MNVALHPPPTSREQFLDWVQRQEAPYEFDGVRPVPMTGGSRRHGQIAANLLIALRAHLQGTGMMPLLEVGLATGVDSVRYPDAIVTPTRGSGDDLLIPDVIVAFEIVSPSSEITDRVVKVREYLCVPSLRRYVILEQRRAAATMFERREGEAEWRVTVLFGGETLRLPEIGAEIGVSEFYEDVDLPEEPTGSGEAA